ncbi:MAG: hypothetical protein K2N73_08845 [Lachnospiraceae bacterium]|nr:hypothetical protein [Lachnospiraceae bacterium]
MSKDLEKEYRALVSCEVPDLWARIEAGLDDKDGSVCKTCNKNIFPIKVWATVAAACVCVGLIIPVMKAHMGGMKEMEGSRSDTAAPEYAANNVDGYEAEEHFMVENQAAARDDADSGAGYSVDSIAEDAVITAEAAYDKSGMAENAAEVVPDVFWAKVKIVGVDVRTDSGIVYRASVAESENPALREGTEIKITVSMAEDEEEGFEVGNIYELTVQEENTEELTYSIVK